MKTLLRKAIGPVFLVFLIVFSFLGILTSLTLAATTLTIAGQVWTLAVGGGIIGGGISSILCFSGAVGLLAQRWKEHHARKKLSTLP